MIQLQGIRKVFTGPTGEDVVAVDGVDLDIAEGETICLIGTSGCGKTTTMKMINRLVEPTSGKIYVDGKEIRERDVIELRRSIGYVIQSGGLFPHRTVAQNVGLLCRLERWPEKKTSERVDELLQMVNLPPGEFAARYPSELSGGQRQRIGVARALALDPAYILMDEPFGALDPITREQIHAEFIELKARVKKTIIMVTHDMDEAFKLADRVAIMDKGRLLEIGDRETLENSDSSFVTDFVKGHSH